MCMLRTEARQSRVVMFLNSHCRRGKSRQTVNLTISIWEIILCSVQVTMNTVMVIFWIAPALGCITSQSPGPLVPPPLLLRFGDVRVKSEFKYICSPTVLSDSTVGFRGN
jgi:hypothetical protein